MWLTLEQLNFVLYLYPPTKKQSNYFHDEETRCCHLGLVICQRYPSVGPGYEGHFQKHPNANVIL